MGSVGVPPEPAQKHTSVRAAQYELSTASMHIPMSMCRPTTASCAAAHLCTFDLAQVLLGGDMLLQGQRIEQQLAVACPALQRPSRRLVVRARLCHLQPAPEQFLTLAIITLPCTRHLHALLVLPRCGGELSRMHTVQHVSMCPQLFTHFLTLSDLPSPRHPAHCQSHLLTGPAAAACPLAR